GRGEGLHGGHRVARDQSLRDRVLPPESAGPLGRPSDPDLVRRRSVGVGHSGPDRDSVLALSVRRRPDLRATGPGLPPSRNRPQAEKNDDGIEEGAENEAEEGSPQPPPRHQVEIAAIEEVPRMIPLFGQAAHPGNPLSDGRGMQRFEDLSPAGKEALNLKAFRWLAVGPQEPALLLRIEADEGDDGEPGGRLSRHLDLLL